MKHRIELRERDMTFVNVLDDRAIDLKWGFDPVGGCSEFSFKAPSKYCTEIDLGANFNVRIYLRNEATKAYDLAYQGRLESHNVSLDKPETIEVQGFGYQSQLQDIVINTTYSSQEISVIVKSILDNHVVPNTDITYDAGDVPATTFTPNSIKFEYSTAQEAFAKLADIVGNIEWGVDKNRKFYFKARSEVVGFYYPAGSKEILNFRMGVSAMEITNRVIVRGDAGYVRTVDYASSQLKYKRRDKVIQNAGITTDAVADQFANAYQDPRNDATDRGSIKINDNVVFESAIPIPLIEVDTRETVYDEKEYDTFLYAGQPPFRIRRISYTVGRNKDLVAVLELGTNLPEFVEKIKQIEYNLEQATQRS